MSHIIGAKEKPIATVIFGEMSRTSSAMSFHTYVRQYAQRGGVTLLYDRLHLPTYILVSYLLQSPELLWAVSALCIIVIHANHLRG